MRTDMRSLPHTREATARSAAMDEGLGDGTGSPLDAQLDDDDGRCAGVRRVRPHHGPQRRLLQVPQLRQQHGLQLTSHPYCTKRFR